MPQITNQKKLFKDFDISLLTTGPKGGWTGAYLKCPICSYFVFRGAGYDQCPCDNIVIDSDYCRVTVKDSAESEIEVYAATPKQSPSEQTSGANHLPRLELKPSWKL